MAAHRRDSTFEVELGVAVCRCLQQFGHSAKLVYDGEAAGLDADVLLLLINLGQFSRILRPIEAGRCRVGRRWLLWQMDPLPPVGLDPEAERIGLAASRWKSILRLNRSAAAMPRWEKLLTLIRLREWAYKQFSAPGFRRSWRIMQNTPGMDHDFDWQQVRGVMKAWSIIREAHHGNWVDYFVASTQQRQRFFNERGIMADFVPVGAYAEAGRGTGNTAGYPGRIPWNREAWPACGHVG